MTVEFSRGVALLLSPLVAVAVACGGAPAVVAPQRDAAAVDDPAAEPPEPPIARRGDDVGFHHGLEVPDPYRWLEGAGADVDAWRRAHDAYARRRLGALPGRDALEEQILAATRAARRLAPQPAGDWLVAVETTGGPLNAASIVARARTRAPGDAGSERVLLDGNRLRAADKRLHLRVWPSPDGRLLAFGVLPLGGRTLELRVLDVETATERPFVATGLVAGRSTVSWVGGSAGLVYARFDEPGADRNAPLRNPRVVVRRLGEATERVLLRGDHDRRVLSNWTRTGSDGDVVIARRDGARSDLWLVRDVLGAARPIELAPWTDGAYSYGGDLAAGLVFATTVGAGTGHVRVATVRGARVQWRTLVAEGDRPIESWVGLGEMIAVIDGRVAVVYRRDDGWTIRAHDDAGRALYDADLPVGASMWTGLVADRGHGAAYLSLSGFVDPGSAYRLDVSDGALARWSSSDVAYDLDDYVTEIVRYPGPDGRQVPIFVARRRDLRADGARPVLLYGYGWGGWSAAPWFRPHVQALLDRGGIMALPVLRGGGEYGEAWHRTGVGRHRRNAIDDYLAAARALAAGPWTSRGKLIAEGQSAGGSLVAMAVLAEPALFGAQLLAFPVLDMLRYERFTGAGAWIAEFGSVDDPSGFEVLRATSPVHAVGDQTCAPPTLLLPGELDDTTPPLHAYKYAAALRHAHRCDHPVWLRIAWGAGHAYGTTPRETAASFAAQLSFALTALSASPADDRNAD